MSSFAATGSIGGFAPSSTSSAPRTRLRLTRRGRVVFTALAGIPVAVLAMAVVLGTGAAAADTEIGGMTFRTVTVAAGDTLWELAESIAPSEDPRDVIAEILRINGLDDGAIQPGQQLALPVLE